MNNLNIEIVRYRGDDGDAILPLIAEFNAEIQVDKHRTPSPQEWLTTQVLHGYNFKCLYSDGINSDTRIMVGWLCYRWGGEEMAAVYIRPEYRGKGLMKAFLYSFPGLKEIRYAVHKHRTDEAIVDKAKNIISSGIPNKYKPDLLVNYTVRLEE